MLALVAGAGRLPAILAARLAARGAPWRLCAVEGALPDFAAPDHVFRVERLAGFLTDLRHAGVDEICFAGAMRRPRIDPAQLDDATRPLIGRIAAAMQAGDDGTLRALLALVEEAGFAVRAAHEVAPDLLPAAGVLTATRPDDRACADAARGAAIVAALGAADVGQACVVAQGQALAVEALPGTDAMLAAVAGLDPRLRPDPSRGQGVLVKGPKPGQDRRVDLPTVGPDTVRAAAGAGLAGLAVEAGGVLLLDRDRALELADAAGMFLWVREAGG